MKSRNFANALLTSAIVLGCGVGVANAADAPKDNKGFTASKTTVVDLGPEIEGMAGRQLRLRLLTIEPGGHIGLHSHKDRPAVVYFLTGQRYGHLLPMARLRLLVLAIRRRPIRKPRIGTTTTATTTVTLIAVDVFKPAK